MKIIGRGMSGKTSWNSSPTVAAVWYRSFHLLTPFHQNQALSRQWLLMCWYSQVSLGNYKMLVCSHQKKYASTCPHLHILLIFQKFKQGCQNCSSNWQGHQLSICLSIHPPIHPVSNQLQTECWCVLLCPAVLTKGVVTFYPLKHILFLVPSRKLYTSLKDAVLVFLYHDSKEKQMHAT